eukprot:gene358-203_t
MYIDDADWLHSLEEASAAHATTCFANCRVCPPCLTHCGALRRSTTKSKSPPARPLKNVTQRANQLLRAFAFSPCSDAEMRSERTHAGPQFLLDCLFCSSTNRFVLSRFFQVVPLAHCIVDSHVRLFRSRVMHLKPISSRSREEDALDEWFLDDPKKKTLKGFAPLMPPEWQLARIARVLAALLPRRGRVMFRCFRALLDHLPAAQEAMVQSEARKMGFECPASAFERTFTLAVARSMPPSLLFCFAFLLSHFSFFFFKSSLCRATSHRWKADVAATRATGSGVGVAEQSGAPEPHLVTYAAMISSVSLLQAIYVEMTASS